MFAAKLRSRRLQGANSTRSHEVSNTRCPTSKERKTTRFFIGKGLADYLRNVNGTVTLPQCNIPLGVEVLHRLGLGLRQDYTSQYHWTPAFGPSLLNSHKLQLLCPVLKPNSWHYPRDGRGATSTTTDRRSSTGMGLTMFNYDHKTITLLTDSASTKSLARGLDMIRRSRHISLRVLWTQATTTWRSRHTKSDYGRESCGHLHQATTCQHTTEALEGQWTTGTCRRRGGR